MEDAAPPLPAACEDVSAEIDAAARGPEANVGAEKVDPQQEIAQEPAAAAPMPPLPADSDDAQALVEHGAPPPLPPSTSSESESESEEDQHVVLAGPIEPERCAASGPGFSGGAAGTPARLVLLAKDSAGRRLRDGGAYVLVCVEPAGPGAGADAEPIEASVVDNKDGSYTATYTVPSKGNYELSIEVNGDPIGGSPFPVFFSAPDKDAAALAPASAQPPPPTGPPPPPPSAEASAAAASTAAAAATATAASMPMMHYPNLSTGLNMSLGIQAAQVGVSFPPSADPAKLARSVLVGGVSPFATQDALRSVFALCGAISAIEMAGPTRSFAFIEFESERGAAAAARMSGVQLIGQGLRVEVALEAKRAAESVAVASNPFYAMQVQQVQAFQMMQQQQGALAQHIAQLRASQHGVAAAAAAAAGAPPPGGREAALAAAAALARRLAGAEPQKQPERRGGGGERKRSRSRDRCPRHRSTSRSISRDRERRRRGEEQRSSRRRSRSRERERGGEGRRRRSGSRERRHKERGHEKHGRKKSRKDKDRSREGGRRRDGDKWRGSGGGEGQEEGRVAAADAPAAAALGANGKVEATATAPIDELEELLNELGG